MLEVWVCRVSSCDGGSLQAVFATEALALDWLRKEHVIHSERAVGMNEYLKASGREPHWVVSDIRTLGSRSHCFDDNELDYYVAEPWEVQGRDTSDGAMTDYGITYGEFRERIASIERGEGVPHEEVVRRFRAKL